MSNIPKRQCPALFCQWYHIFNDILPAIFVSNFLFVLVGLLVQHYCLFFTLLFCLPFLTSLAPMSFSCFQAILSRASAILFSFLVCPFDFCCVQDVYSFSGIALLRPRSATTLSSFIVYFMVYVVSLTTKECLRVANVMIKDPLACNTFLDKLALQWLFFMLLEQSILLETCMSTFLWLHQDIDVIWCFWCLRKVTKLILATPKIRT